MGYGWLQWVTVGYSDLQWVTLGYNVTIGYNGL